MIVELLFSNVLLVLTSKIPQVAMLWVNIYTKIRFGNQLASQEAQRQTVVIAIMIGELHRFCITSYTGDWTYPITCGDCKARDFMYKKQTRYGRCINFSNKKTNIQHTQNSIVQFTLSTAIYFAVV